MGAENAEIQQNKGENLLAHQAVHRRTQTGCMQASPHSFFVYPLTTSAISAFSAVSRTLINNYTQKPFVKI